jgi:long-chain fatty acid transport protein
MKKKQGWVMPKQSTYLYATMLGVAGATCLSSAAFASGFALREGATDWLGTSFAGDTAKAYDASTVWSNPAGMARLDDSELDASANLIAPDARFSGTNSDPFGGNVSGSNGGNAVQAAATGGLFGVWVLSPRIRLGFGVTAPFGERVSYPEDFVGRFQSLVSSITDINLGLAASYKFNDHLSIGGGPNIDYFSARLTQAINAGPLNNFGTATGDVHGDDVGVGFNFGVLYQFTDATRIGVDYRSRITHDIDGDQKISVPAIFGVLSPTTAAELNAANGGAKTSITLPDSLSFGFYHQINEKWAVMSDIQWTHWSLFNNVTITSDNAGVPPTTIAENWQNTWYGGIGFSYQPIQKLTLLTGASYDQSPVTDSNRTTRIPDSDHYNVGIGAKYQILASTSLQIAYGHTFTPGGTIDNSASTLAGVIAGSYDTSANSVSAGMTVKF